MTSAPSSPFPGAASSRVGASQQSAGGPSALMPAAALSLQLAAEDTAFGRRVLGRRARFQGTRQESPELIPLAATQKAPHRSSCGNLPRSRARGQECSGLIISSRMIQRERIERCKRIATHMPTPALRSPFLIVRAADPASLFLPGGRTLADVWGMR